MPRLATFSAPDGTTYQAPAEIFVVSYVPDAYEGDVADLCHYYEEAAAKREFERLVAAEYAAHRAELDRDIATARERLALLTEDDHAWLDIEFIAARARGKGTRRGARELMAEYGRAPMHDPRAWLEELTARSEADSLESWAAGPDTHYRLGSLQIDDFGAVIPAHVTPA